MTHLSEQARTYAAYLPIPVLMALREERAMKSPKKFMDMDLEELRTEVLSLDRDNAALLAACKAYREQHDAVRWETFRPCRCDTCASAQKVIDEMQAETP